jgi:hypothetical protein
MAALEALVSAQRTRVRTWRGTGAVTALWLLPGPLVALATALGMDALYVPLLVRLQLAQRTTSHTIDAGQAGTVLAQAVAASFCAAVLPIGAFVLHLGNTFCPVPRIDFAIRPLASLWCVPRAAAGPLQPPQPLRSAHWQCYQVPPCMRCTRCADVMRAEGVLCMGVG